MRKGTVVWFSEERGYGFIRPEDGGVDVYVHWTAISRHDADNRGRRNLQQGQRVEFHQEPDAKGPKAVEVRVLGGGQ